MSTVLKVQRDVLGIIGLLLIVAGILCNPWLLGLLVSLRGEITDSSIRVGLWVGAAVLVVLGIYLMVADRRMLRRNLPNFGLMILTLLITAGVAYTGSVSLRSLRIYRHLKKADRGWRGHLYRGDPELGFMHIPDSRGFMTFPSGPDLAVRIDERGFRVPNDENAVAANPRPLVLSLGCSVTFGDACLAEDAFTYRVGLALGGTSLNAGVCSYGLEQMLPLARRLIPKYKPDYVLVQYSGWLVARALTGYAPAYYGLVPVPFYTRDDSGKCYLHPRLFPARIFDLPVWQYRGGSKGVFNFISFLGRVGFRLFIYDDCKMLEVHVQEVWSKIRHGHGIFGDNDLPREVIDYTYGEIAKICRENGAQMIIVNLGVDLNGRKTFDLPAIPGVTFVNAEAELGRRLPDKNQDTYNRAYGHWRGNPPVFVDSHPNPTAHTIIAEEIVKAIKNSNGIGDTLCHQK